jgi:hypothetical protein
MAVGSSLIADRRQLPGAHCRLRAEFGSSKYGLIPLGEAEMTDNMNKQIFESHYAGQAPWDIGKPQKAFIDVADLITGSVLDVGCGTGVVVHRVFLRENA